MDYSEFSLNTYKYPPSETCTIQELEKICEERLELYKIMETAKNFQLEPNTKKWEEYVESEINKNRLRSYCTLLKNEKCHVGLSRARRNDHIAHWLLSLCYCRTSDLRYFFMCWELHWFSMLYKRMSKEDLKEFLAQNEFKYKQVDPEEKNLLADKLLKCRNIKDKAFNNLTYYKTVFTEVTNLVIKRKVFLYRGFAYFPETDIIFCVKNRLWRQFSLQLSWTNQVLPIAVKEDRIQDFLKNVALVEPVEHLTSKVTEITVDNIDRFAETNFPLCMKSLHSIVRRDHHLKYDCKMQYGVFLKCLGLSYEDAMEFWKQEFTKKMSLEYYDRYYSYLFKHHYGKVGGRLNYQPYSCEKIFKYCPGVGQHHGCPFKHWDLDKLLQRCQADGLHVKNINNIKDLVISNKLKEACTAYFCARHKVVTADVIQSPNHYFQQSYELESSLEGCLNTMVDSLENDVGL